MQITYTIPQAKALIFESNPEQAPGLIEQSKKEIKYIASLFTWTYREAFNEILKTTSPSSAFYYFVAVDELEQELDNHNAEILKTINQLEHEKQQLANQMFVLERSNTATDKTELRSIYTTQIQAKTRQIQQHVNTFEVNNAIVLKPESNC